MIETSRNICKYEEENQKRKIVSLKILKLLNLEKISFCIILYYIRFDLFRDRVSLW